MDTQRIIQKLECVVRVGIPLISLNVPKFDEKLLKAHYLLARLYGDKGDTSEAHSHLRQAEHEFFNMCRVETEELIYISGGLEGFRQFREQERKTEKRLEHYRRKLFDIANKIGYDVTNLLLVPACTNKFKLKPEQSY